MLVRYLTQNKDLDTISYIIYTLKAFPGSTFLETNKNSKKIPLLIYETY